MVNKLHFKIWNLVHISQFKRFGKRIGEPVIVYTKDLAVKDGTLCIPIYMAIFL